MITTGQALAVTLYLLPGLLGLFILETLAERVSSDNLRRLTLVVTIALFAAAIVIKIGDYDALPALNGGVVDFNTFLETSFFWSCITGLGLGVLGALLSNFSVINWLLGKFVGTTKTGKMDVWHQVFTSFDEKWCRVRYKSGDQLIGHPKFHSISGENRELFIRDATWYRKDDSGYERNDVKGYGVIVVDFDDVETVEILDGN